MSNLPNSGEVNEKQTENSIKMDSNDDIYDMSNKKRKVSIASIGSSSAGSDSVSLNNRIYHTQTNNSSHTGTRTQFGFSKISNSNGSYNKENSSILTSIYEQNDSKLIELQNTLFSKKSSLDAQKDELEEYKQEFKEILKKWESLRDQKVTQQKELNFKSNEVIKLQSQFLSKKEFMNKENELKLQHLKAINKSNMNKLSSEYMSDLDKLRFEKIKKYEDEKELLSEKLRNLRNEISLQPTVFSNKKDEIKTISNNVKESWDKDLELKISREEDIRKELDEELSTHRNNIENSLKPDLKKLEEEIHTFKTELEEFEKKYEVNVDEADKIKTNIKAKNNEIEEINSENKQLTEYLENAKAELIETTQLLIKEESMRRVLHNRLQDLRGNIRVFCRLRPPLQGREDVDTSNIKIKPFDNNYGTQSMNITKENGEPQIFKFDRIFEPNETNKDVFEEIGQLVQSSLDGHNVCIFAYGQTGSGKTYTMLNEKDGMIPATISHIFDWTETLREKGWNYEISCQFIEIYNEAIIDLLRESPSEANDNTNPDKHEIRHDKDLRTTKITNVKTYVLQRKDTVDALLKSATKLRSTASTSANERSSRSHSIFMISLKGKNEITGDMSEGILNLVDLAGSERLNSSQVAGARLRETQNINRSLSCLGDVIHALGQNDTMKRHIPFRNSKLTYLLQYSLTGTSKTLMFVNISPTTPHLNETLNSLRFAAKVNSTKMTSKNN